MVEIELTSLIRKINVRILVVLKFIFGIYLTTHSKYIDFYFWVRDVHINYFFFYI